MLLIAMLLTLYNSPMVDAKWVDDRYGMSLSKGPHPSRDNENGVLFYLEYILMKEAQGQDIQDDVKEFKQIVENIRTHAVDGHKLRGLYDRGEDESLSPDKANLRVISHDNLTAIAAFDARYGNGEEAADIALRGILNTLRYDNVYPEKPRWVTIQWPTDWAFWAISSNKWYYQPLVAAWFPLFAVRSILANFSKKSDTSGKLLNFVRFASLKDKNPIMRLLWKISVMQWKWQYGDNWLHEVMSIYFQDPTHPNRALSENIKF